MTKRDEKRYATVRHPTIEGVVKGLFRFQDIGQAQNRMNAIRNHFILSRQHDPELVLEGAARKAASEGAGVVQELEKTNAQEAVLWIRGFHTTLAEEEKGFLGHFARITIQEMKDGRFTLKAVKLDVPMKNHPFKKRIAAKHPNWGHPLLRQIKKEQTYATVEEAEAVLQALHEEYPDVSIPTGTKLYIMVFTRRVEGRPIEKLIFEVTALPSGGCTILWKENVKPFKTKEEKKAPLPGEITEETLRPDDEKQGKFSTMVEIRRKNKRKKTMKIKPQELPDE